jgi:Alkylmercury lyase
MAEATVKELRKYIFDCFVATARPPLLEEIMAQYSWSRDEGFSRLQELQGAHHILLLPGTQRILMANPFSGLPTPFRARTERHEYYANCAWDAIALHVVLDQDVSVSSFCHHCGEGIHFSLRNGRLVSPEGRDVLVFLQTPVARWYDNLLLTCSNAMVFFHSQQHLEEWRAAHPDFSGESLTIERMIDVVTPISKGRTCLDYRMPSREELMGHWDSIGLRGAFWRF